MSKKILLIIALSLFIAFVGFSYTVGREKYTQIDFDSTIKLQDHLSRRLDMPFSLISLVGSAEITLVFWLGLLIFLAAKKYYHSVIGLLLFPLSALIEIYGKLVLFHP